MSVRRDHADECAHRVADERGSPDADMIEHGDEVFGMGGHRERPSDAVGPTATSKVGGQHRHPFAEAVGEDTERAVRRRDPMDGHDHRRPGSPASDAEAAAVDVDVEGGVRGLGHGVLLLARSFD